MQIRRGAYGFLSTEELEAEPVTILPVRAALSAFDVAGLTAIPMPTDLVGLASDAGAASGSPDQAAQLAHNFASPPM